MIIEAKATRQGPGQDDPAQRYVLKNADRKTRTPFVLGLMLTGLIIYLKSLFPSAARPQDEAGPLPADDANGVAEEPMTAAQQVPPELDHTPVGTTPAPSPGALGSGSGLIDLQPPAEFIFVESPEIGFAMPEPYVGLAEFAKLDIGFLAANDNVGAGEENPQSPGNPVDSVDPVDPIDPVDPVDPTGPVDPTDPEDPGCESKCNGTPGNCDDDDDEEDAANRAPRITGPVYLMDVTGCAILAIGLTELLRNASDPDGDALSVKNLTVSSGTLTQSGEGWVFQGGARLEGLVTITYEVTDGEFSVAQTASFSVRRNVVEGSCADDIIVGSMCADDIDGMEGDDNIDARAGNDVVAGGDGNDHIVAGDGCDVVFAGAGDDIVFGGAGNDQISGGKGNDRLYGEAGDDVIFGDEGNDLVSGGDGEDVLDGGDGDDLVQGGDGDDVLIGGAGKDRLEGGAGNDMLVDGAGEDETFGGAGDDHVVAALDQADDRHDGGEGHDTLDYSRTAQGVEVDLVEGKACGAEIGTDTVTNFEEVVGGAGDDHITVDDAVATVLAGGDGDDTFEFVPSGNHAPTTHTILDFEVGDRIRMSKYDLFEKVMDELEEQFEAIYGDDIDDDDIPIRYSHDRTDELNRTLVEADFNNDDIWETTIVLDGHRVLVVVEHA